ncbi:MAG: hypothetical protein JO184_18405 [Gammaproteobacteria bacterium]|nr:hypothetical protein [Gammaproteobacteria bacterium]MBV8307764.1 hypothetical protein [Gammaproteobacteria bacterium]
MPTVRATLLLLCMALPGCAGSRLAEQAPPGVNLAGTWKLDHGASDDPQKVLEHMREQAMKIIGRPQQQTAVMPARGGRPGHTSTPTPDSGSDPTLAQAPPPGAHFDPLLRSPMAHIINKTVARGDFLTVRQGPGEFALDYGGVRRTFTPGQHSVVSVEGGVGDQTSGWKGPEYVIEVKEQNGPRVTEEYGLSPDGKELLAKLHISAAELPAVSLLRVYRPTDQSAPPPLPIND